MHDSADQVDFDTVKVSRPSTAFNLFASPAFFRTGAAKKAFGDPQGFITALGEKFTDLASIQLLKPSAKVAKIVDITATADDDDGAAAALANAAAAAADMSKELLDSLPLEEVKKRTILQQQRLKSLGASLKNDQIRSRRIVKEQQLQALIERQNKELSELLWRRGEGERQLVAAETTYAQECTAAAGLAAGAEGPEHLKDAEARLKKLDKELQEERQYSSTLELMRSRAQEQLSSKKSLIDKLYQDIAAHKHDLQLLQKQTEDVQRQQESLEDYLKAYRKMNQLEVRSHNIQTKQRAKSREGDKLAGSKSRGSPGGHEAGQTKGPEVGGSARAEDRTLHDIENISVLETEDAVKKIYLITGEHDAAGVISKWEQRGANMSVWQGLAEETEAHWEKLLKEKEILTRQVQQKFAFASTATSAMSPTSSPGAPVPDLQALAESQIKSVSDALNKRTAAVEATAALLSRHEGLLDDMKHGLGFLMAKSKTLLDDPKIGSKIVKENTTSFSKLFGDTIAKGMAREEDKRSVGDEFNPKQYEGLLPKEFLNLPTTVRALERMLVATLGVVEVECPAIFEKMQPKAKVAMTVESVMNEAVAALPMVTSELVPLQDVSLENLAKASGSMENNLRIRLAEEKIAEEELMADIAMEEDDDDVDDDESEGMGLSFMQRRSAFKESSDRRARAEQRKIKVAAAPLLIDD